MVPGLGLTVMSHVKLTFSMEIHQLMFANSSSHAMQLDLQTMAVSVTCMDREKLRHLDENLTMTETQWQTCTFVASQNNYCGALSMLYSLIKKQPAR